MGLKPGMTNNRNGRPLGALSKIAPELRNKISDFLENNFDEVVNEWKRLDGKEKVSAYKDLLSFVLPKMQSMELRSEFESLPDKQIDEIINRLKSEK